MGESTVKNVDPRLGSLRWASWTNRGGNQALIQRQLTTLIPVQELLPFQRQIVEQEIDIGLVTGQRAVYQADVPIDEAWRFLDATIVHNDSISHVVVWVYFTRLGIGDLKMIARKTVTANRDTPLARSFSEENDITRFAPRGWGPIEFFPNDRVNFIDETVAVNANVTWQLRLRYEQIPLPLTQVIGSEFIGTNV